MGDSTIASFVLLGVFLVVGLLMYERRALRMGGVLVMPLLAVYALFDLSVLPVFFASAAVTFAGGETVHKRTLLYGRRMFVVYLLLSISATFVASQLVGLAAVGPVMAVLPGLFAFNLHREGRPLRGFALFAAWLAALLLVGLAGFMLADVPAMGVQVLGPPLAGAAIAALALLPGLDLAGLPGLAAALGEGARGAAAAVPVALVGAVDSPAGAGGLLALGLLDDLLGGDGE